MNFTTHEDCLQFDSNDDVIQFLEYVIAGLTQERDKYHSGSAVWLYFQSEIDKIEKQKLSILP
jgi:hypothetical protein